MGLWRELRNRKSRRLLEARRAEALSAPDNAPLQLRTAEAYAAAGEPVQAAFFFARAATRFEELGFVHRAVAALHFAQQQLPLDAKLARRLRALEGARRGPQLRTHPAPRAPLAPPPLALDGGLQLRRISDFTVAVRQPGKGAWMLLHSEAPLHAEYMDELPPAQKSERAAPEGAALSDASAEAAS